MTAEELSDSHAVGLGELPQRAELERYQLVERGRLI